MANEISYAINLGGGLYMDSNGVLHQAEPAKVPVFNAPFALPVDPEKVKKALEATNKFLADASDPKTSKKFTDLGVPLELFDLLSAVGKVAGIIAPYIAVIALAYDALRIIGIIKSESGPTPLEQLLDKRFTEIQKTITSLGTLIRLNNIEGGKEMVVNFLTDIKTYNEQLQKSNPDITQLENDRNRLLTAHSNNRPGFDRLLKHTTYYAVFDATEHTLVWPYIHNLFTHPAKSVQPKAAKMPAVGEARLDHRLMVPLAAYASESYLACIRGISPEHRTTGDFRDSIKELTLEQDQLAFYMLDMCLSRTIYTANDFKTAYLTSADVIDHLLMPEADITISPKCGKFPVGALDLRYHNDAFFGKFFDELSKNEWLGLPSTTKHGSMEFRWIPPAKMKRVVSEVSVELPGTTVPAINVPTHYIITNPEECAAAANEQSKLDYADLLVTSGYSNLLHLGGLYRNEFTEPEKSQTVYGDVTLTRIEQPETTVTVKSEPIIMTGVIEASAKRHLNECSAAVHVSTQTIKRARPIEYTIKLRILHSINTYGYGGASAMRWRNTTYEDYQTTQYDNDLANPGFLKLSVIHKEGMQLDEHEITAGSSPREPKHIEGTAEMVAHTFDWWIPVKPPFSINPDMMERFAKLRATGWVGPATKGDTMDGQTIVPLSYKKVKPGSYYDPISKISNNGEQDWEGEHRDVQESKVKIDYKLDWDADRLTISLKNRPTDRNYIVYVVIEEKMLYSGQVLHTAIPVPVDGQLTYIPQSFFDEEKAANEKFGKAVNKFNNKYSKSVRVGPKDPVLGWVRPADLVKTEVLQHIVTLAKKHSPELLQSVMNEREDKQTSA